MLILFVLIPVFYFLMRSLFLYIIHLCPFENKVIVDRLSTRRIL
jgi:hypothetical protein